MAIFSISGSGIVWEAVLEKEIFEFCKSIFAISWLYSLEKGVALHLNKLDSLHPRRPCAKFGWIWSGGSTRSRLIEWLFGVFTPYRQYSSHVAAAEVEIVKNVKSLQTGRQTDDGQQAIRKAHLGFQLRWAKYPSPSPLEQSILEGSSILEVIQGLTHLVTYNTENKKKIWLIDNNTCSNCYLVYLSELS